MTLSSIPNRLVLRSLLRAAAALAFVSLSASPLQAIPTTAAAEHALMQGDADSAVSLLHNVLAADPHNGEAHLLLCRVFYAEVIPDQAAAECDAALATLSNDSTAQDWAGRAFGIEADSSGPVAGLRLARRVKLAFETAVHLDPTNAAAIEDLSEYYIDAPYIVGGSFEKAAHLADRIEDRLPQQAHRIRALAAEKQKNYAVAEREFRAEVSVAGHPDAWIDLGIYYVHRQQPDQAVDALRHAIAADLTHDAALVDAALTLDEIHREPRLAEHAFRDYLGSRNKSDAAPAFAVHVDLARLLIANGDKPAAKIELDRALALAANYAPARKELAGL